MQTERVFDHSGCDEVPGGFSWVGIGPDAVGGVPSEVLEEQLRTLAGHVAAATCSFLVLVGEYDRRRGWADWECLSCAHWLSWRCGVGMVAAREQVRVARALRSLPAVCSAFSEGRLSYSKVRAITRVAHANNEDGLVEVARWATAAQVERLCSALRRVIANADADTETDDADTETDDADAVLLDTEQRSRTLRSLRWRTDPDSGDLLVTARIPAGADADGFVAAIDDRTLDTAADGEPLDTPDQRRLDALLDTIATNDAAANESDPHPSAGGSLAVQPEVVVHHHRTPDPGPCPRQGEHDTGSIGRTDSIGRTGSIDTDPLSGPDRWPWVTSRGQQLSHAAYTTLACDAGLRTVTRLPDGLELDCRPHQRFPNRALRRAVFARDGRCCRFPGCERRHRLHVHHIIHWENGGPTIAANLLLLCPTHHQAVHTRNWTLTGTADNAVFTRPDGIVVDDTAPPLHGATAELADAFTRHGLDIAADGASGHWVGDRIDWDCFFAAFANGPRAHIPTHDAARLSESR